MPRETCEYYRYRKIFSNIEKNSPYFNEIKRLSEEIIERELPEDANDFWSWSEFEHEHETIEGAVVINYFENEDEAKRYEAVYCGDDSIYADYLKRKEEIEELRLHRKKAS